MKTPKKLPGNDLLLIGQTEPLQRHTKQIGNQSGMDHPITDTLTHGPRA